MNLEYDDVEATIIREAGAVFSALAHDSASKSKVPQHVWRQLVATGWSDLGSSVEEGELSIGVVVGICREAGRHLLVDQYVNSGYILSALSAYCRDDSRPNLLTNLRDRPGVFVGDGRDALVPLCSTDRSDGYCFGAEGEFDVYRLAQVPDGQFILSRWEGISPAVQLTRHSMSVASVRVPPGGSWQHHPLTMDNPRLVALQRESLWLQSAALVGCAEQILADTCAYANTRTQFGAPIGSFQAVKHALADVLTALTVAWNSLLCATAAGTDDALATPAARFLVQEAAMSSARTAAQVYGGIGYTLELPLHKFLRTVLDGSSRCGSSTETATALVMNWKQATC